MSTPEPGRRYISRTNSDRIVTVTRVFPAIVNDGTGVAYDIWEPGYQGAPGSWGSAIDVDRFHELYHPEETP